MLIESATRMRSYAGRGPRVPRGAPCTPSRRVTHHLRNSPLRSHVPNPWRAQTHLHVRRVVEVLKIVCRARLAHARCSYQCRVRCRRTGLAALLPARCGALRARRRAPRRSHICAA